jgi:hypothetical protein
MMFFHFLFVMRGSVRDQLSFFEEKKFTSSFSISSVEVQARIEVIVIELLSKLVDHGQFLDLEFVSFDLFKLKLKEFNFKVSILKSNALFSLKDSVRLGNKRSIRSAHRNPFGFLQGKEQKVFIKIFQQKLQFGVFLILCISCPLAISLFHSALVIGIN